VIEAKTANFTVAAVANTNYMYVCTNTITATMPAVTGNSNRYTIANAGAGVVTVDGDGAETIEGDASIDLDPGHSVDLIRDTTTNWKII
jgi:hypothetical protein